MKINTSILQPRINQFKNFGVYLSKHYSIHMLFIFTNMEYQIYTSHINTTISICRAFYSPLNAPLSPFKENSSSRQPLIDYLYSYTFLMSYKWNYKVCTFLCFKSLLSIMQCIALIIYITQYSTVWMFYTYSVNIWWAVCLVFGVY